MREDIYFKGAKRESDFWLIYSVAERWSRDPGSRVQFPAGGFGVAFFATGPGWVLKCISF